MGERFRHDRAAQGRLLEWVTAAVIVLERELPLRGGVDQLSQYAWLGEFRGYRRALHHGAGLNAIAWDVNYNLRDLFCSRDQLQARRDEVARRSEAILARQREALLLRAAGLGGDTSSSAAPDPTPKTFGSDQ